MYKMINFQAATDFVTKHFCESVNHSNSKALPVLQTDLNLEQEGGRALRFKSGGLGCQIPCSAHFVSVGICS